MKNFIEVTVVTVDDGEIYNPHVINIDTIYEISKNDKYKNIEQLKEVNTRIVVGITNVKVKTLNVKETYEQIKKMIEEAQK